MRFLAMALAIAAGCGGEKDGGSSGGDDSSDPDDVKTFEDFINVTDAPAGDFTGFEGYEQNGGWLVQDVDEERVGLAPMTGVVTDFQDGYAVSGADLEVWFDDVVEGPADLKVTADESGLVSGEVYTCQAMALLVSTDPDLEESKPTYELHQTYAYEKAVDDIYNSVSTSTFRLIPGLLGVDPDPDKGIIAGSAYDANEDPIMGAQVIVRDDEGNIPQSLVVKYFVEKFPNREQPYTSEDGLWVAINVPAGDWNVEMYVSDGAGGHDLIGATRLPVVADSINISSMYLGVGDGVKYDESCLVQ